MGKKWANWILAIISTIGRIFYYPSQRKILKGFWSIMVLCNYSYFFYENWVRNEQMNPNIQEIENLDSNAQN